MSTAVPWYIKAVLRIALPAACLAALYLSIPGEVALAKTAGWSEHYAPAMPVCLSVYALAAGAISQYRRKMKLPGERTALIGGVMALLLAMGAQSISHLIEQSYMGTSWRLVVAVSCVPPLVIAHLIHMAETPSQVRSASEEMEELRAVVHAFMAESAASLIGRSQSLVKQCDTVGTVAGELVKAAERENGRWEELLHELEKEPRPLTLTERIEQTRKSLADKHGQVTVANICKTLGISSATYYRHKPSEQSTAGMLPLTA
ncbi:hypothetical protein ACFVYF_19025 [Streptomyces sp. NPDC058274]|uniref:hypothetical protein n=1 Tax=Streptomyces sp. NPDC058274 TaxID=3346416 RepID=UPI0036EF5CFD